MKKLALSILTILYLAGTTGAMLEKHFCMGRVADWSLGKSQGEHCGLCGMEKSAEQDNGCCSDQEGFFKITDDQKIQAGIELGVPVPDFQIITRIHRYNLSAEPKSKAFTKVQLPPGSPTLSRHVLISVFRI